MSDFSEFVLIITAAICPLGLLLVFVWAADFKTDPADLRDPEEPILFTDKDET